jgi:type III pantothenate kinase
MRPSVLTPLRRDRVLVVDVGNTATSFGVFSVPSRGRPLLVHTVDTASLRQRRAASRTLRAVARRLRVTPAHVRGVIVSSVVPAVDRPLRAALRARMKADPHFVSSQASGAVRVRYRNPAEVGADRIVNARAAMALYRGPSVVVDFGTATTFDCITARGEYLGGVIAPGPVISAEALYQRTAKLPRVLLTEPAKILGRNTLESIRSGLYHGYRGLVKEIVSRLKETLGPKTRVFATGGQAHWILKGVSVVDRHVPHLTLLGLYHLWADLEKQP